jgi:hypothetical protein
MGTALPGTVIGHEGNAVSRIAFETCPSWHVLDGLGYSRWVTNSYHHNVIQPLFPVACVTLPSSLPVVFRSSEWGCHSVIAEWWRLASQTITTSIYLLTGHSIVE